jgi:DNA-binding protein HU-beta
MNKQELIDAIAAESELSKKDSKSALEAIVKAISISLKKGDKVALVGFGSFSVVNRAARTGRNPQTGKELKIAAKKSIKFGTGSELEAAIQ